MQKEAMKRLDLNKDLISFSEGVPFSNATNPFSISGQRWSCKFNDHQLITITKLISFDLGFGWSLKARKTRRQEKYKEERKNERDR